MTIQPPTRSADGTAEHAPLAPPAADAQPPARRVDTGARPATNGRVVVGDPRRDSTDTHENPGRRGPSTAGAVGIVVLCTLLFAGLGALLESVRAERYEASTLVRITGDAPLPTDASASNTGGDDRFVQSELLTITGDPVRRVVANRTGSASPSIAATQIGATDVIRITATAARPALAGEQADAAATGYLEARVAATQARLRQATDLVDAQLAAVTAGLAALPPTADGGAAAAEAPQRSALGSEYARLVGLKNQLAALDPALNPPVTIIDSASATGASSTRHVSRTAAIGAFLGALVGLGVVILLQRVRS